jgi:hypothetical protein
MKDVRQNSKPLHREDDMIRSIAILLIGAWYVGLVIGEAMDFWVHVPIAAAIILLIISVKQEVSVYDTLRKTPYIRKY